MLKNPTKYFLKKIFKKVLTNRKLSAIILHVPFTTTLLVRMCWCGSMAEQLICNQQVDGSTPFTSSKYGGFPERPKGADCKSVVTDFGGPNPPSPTNTKARCDCIGLLCWWGMVVRGRRTQGSRSPKPITTPNHRPLSFAARIRAAKKWSRIRHPRFARMTPTAIASGFCVGGGWW